MNSGRLLPLVRTLMGTLGLAALLALVWYLGPLLSVGGVAPLAGTAPRAGALAFVALAVTAAALWRATQAGRDNSRLLDDMVATAGPTLGPQPGEQDLAAIGERFERAVALLKRRRVGGRRAWLGALSGHPYVYELPWYVIIGAPGAGKTTALVHSGLDFPLEAQLGKKMIRGIGGTRNCDWWFTSDAVLIDTAGRYTTQDSHHAADRKAWLGFLDLLTRYRPGRPINGVLLTLSVSDLLGADSQARLAHARTLRERLDELHGRLGVRLPIYVVVTKTDLLAGFMEFFADFDKDERSQVWGVTFPFDTELTSDDPIARLPSDLVWLEKRLNECLIDRLHAEQDRDRRASIYAFPQQWRVLHETLLEVLPAIFTQSPDGQRPFLRGVYFTSATQEGTPMDRAIGAIARGLGLAGRLAPPARPSGKTFFVTRMLRDVVLHEAALAGTNLRWRRRRSVVAWGVTAATVGGVAVAAVMSWHAFASSRDRIGALSSRAAALDGDVAAARRSAVTDLPALLPTLQDLQSLASWRPANAGAWPTMGMDQGDLIASTARDAYRRVLKEAFLPRIAARLELRLRSGGRDHIDRLYEDLKAYLMLFGGRNFDAGALKSFLVADWDATLPTSMRPAERDALRQHLDRLLAGAEVGAPSQADPQLVAQVRGLVAGVPLAQRAYSRLKQIDPGAGATAFSIESAAGPSARRLFARASGERLDRGVPALYTRAVFKQSLQPRTVQVLRQLAGEQNWVLGRSAASAMEPSAQSSLVDAVRKLYVADYTRVWSDFIGDIRLAPAPDLAAVTDQAQQLSHSNSPLHSLLAGVADEVSVVAEPADPAGPARSDAQSLPGFDSLRRYVVGEASALDATIALIGRLSTYLAAVDDAARRHATPPVSDVIRELAAAAPKAPTPVSGMLEQLSRRGAGLAFGALHDTLERQIAGALQPACTRLAGGRYPLVRTGAENMSREDFVKTFGAGGLLDAFFQHGLAPYVDTTTRPWSMMPADGGPPPPAQALLDFQRAQAIRDTFFHDGGRTLGATMEFRLLELDPAVRRFSLDIDGQLMRFARDQRGPVALQWPRPDRPGGVHLRLTTAGGDNGSDFAFEGPWALFHLLDRVRVEPGSTPDKAVLVFDVEGHRARFEVRSVSAHNPLLRDELERFQCPKRL